MLKITSPMATGNGAYIVHKKLEKGIPDYKVKGYSPYLTFMPFILPAAISTKGSELIHTTPDYACFFMQSSTPLIITFHNYVLDPWMKSYSNMAQIIHYATGLRLFTRLAASRAHTITAVSRFTAGLAKKDLELSRNIKTIYNGVDSELFTPKTKKGNANIRVLFSGNISTRKGAHWLGAIAEKLQKNVTVYYTSGLRDSGILPPHKNLKPTGNIPYTDMPDLYRKMDMLLMPTVREGFSLAVLEAMACGLPVVATDCSSLPEQIDHGYGGFLCPIGDIEAFAGRLNLLADSPQQRKEMGKFNRVKVEETFTLAAMLKNYRDLFEETMTTNTV